MTEAEEIRADKPRLDRAMKEGKEKHEKIKAVLTRSEGLRAGKSSDGDGDKG